MNLCQEKDKLKYDNHESLSVNDQIIGILSEDQLIFIIYSLVNAKEVTVTLFKRGAPESGR